MFMQRPEEPGEWAGLPAEPFGSGETTDLPEVAPVDALGGVLGGEVTSVTIDIPTVAPAGEPPSDPEGDTA